MTAPALPRRRANTIAPVKQEYTYSQILNQDISESTRLSIVISKDDLDLDMSKLLEFIQKGVTIKCLDYDSLMFVDGLLDEKVDNKVFLVDDGLRKSREYIDLSKLRNINATVPLTYLLWGVKFNGTVDTYCFKFVDPNTGDFNYTSVNGNENLSLENLKRIKDVISMLSKHNPENDLDKVLLVSDFIQSRTQFVSDVDSESMRGVFVIPGFQEDEDIHKRAGLIETVNNEQYGLCMGIANFSTVLLNNPLFDTETESVFGSSHVWNRVLIDGKYYYFDNTWDITRSDDYHEDGLITLSFQKKYMLFGTKTADSIGHHQAQSLSVYNNGVMSEEDYNRVMDYASKFSYNQTPVYKSYKKTK